MYNLTDSSFCFTIGIEVYEINALDIGCMSKPKLSDEEITQRGKELYENSICPQVETAENIGKIVSINVETGEYEIGDDLLVTSLRLRARTS